MAKEAKPRKSYITPFGIARFPKLNEPDTYFVKKEGDKGVYKTDVVFEGAALEEVKALVAAALKEFWPGKETVDPIKLYHTDKEKKQEQGYGISVKSYNKPALFDSKRKKLGEGKTIGGGSEIRVAGTFVPYEMSGEETIVENGKKRKTRVTNYGITIYVDQVQVRNLVAGRSDDAVFGEVEGGYEYDAGDAGSEAFADDATDL